MDSGLCMCGLGSVSLVDAIGTADTTVRLLTRCDRRHRFARFIGGRIVPRLPFAGRKDVVERGAEDVNAGRNEEDDFPLMHRGLVWGGTK